MASPSERTSYAVTLADVRAAARRIEGVAHRTPVMTCAALSERAGRAVYLKCENLQRVGAFKFRGAWNAVSQLEATVARRGVVTHSSGNHAQALALAARERGIPAHIVMPVNAPRVKQAAVAGYGATIYPCDPTQAAREREAARVVKATGGTLIPPFDHPHIIAGQGTVLLELVEQIDSLDAVVAPVGGGGMISGIALAARELNPDLRIFAAEPTGADDTARSKAAGQRLPVESPDTIADGLRTSIGELCWPVVRDFVEAVYVADDRAIARAMRFVWERAKLIIEPSAAVPVAVVLSDEFRALAGIEKVALVLSGGNVDLDTLPSLLRAGA